MTGKPLRYRQVHLDFHTSEHIPHVGAQFDARQFVATLTSAHVDSITIFAKCHHGWSYYPTTVGAPHPQLERADLLGEMVDALNAADIECPIYISVQWDERTARQHPEWRAVSARNAYHHALPTDASSGKNLSPAWHTICLNHPEYRSYVLAQAREVASHYQTQGLFFDIVLTPDCVCPQCIARMRANGLDPESAADRLKNDEAVNEQFRQEISTALRAEFPRLRIFYNSGHIHKQGRFRFDTYSHLEIESLPTGGWGYDHFPSSARYAATLGFDFVAHTGKFHTSWGEFGGFKHADALDYECAQMVALGSKCLIGDQLHPSGAINPDTYRSIAPAYARVAKLEPYLKGAQQISEVAILSAEHFNPTGGRNNHSDDGAAQMLLELHVPFDVVDRFADFATYKVLILPDEIVLDKATSAQIHAFLNSGGKVIASGLSGLDRLDLGVTRRADDFPFYPSYVKAAKALDKDMPATAFVMYDRPVSVTAAGADVLAEIYPPYFNRTYAHFSSHQHSPDDPDAASLGPAVTLNGNIGYIAYPIFRLYRAVGQPLYKYMVRGLLARLHPQPLLTTDLPSGGRASLTFQAEQGRYVLHVLGGYPQVRGKEIRLDDGSTRIMEMIEDVPTLGAVTSQLRLPHIPVRAYDVLTGNAVAWRVLEDGRIEVTVPKIRIHSAVAFDSN